jgi:trehalose 6-phosphate synthase/phosphatase
MRQLIVSNRLPGTVVRSPDGKLDVMPSSGGLATGLGFVHEASDTLWIGWPGNPADCTEAECDDVGARLAELRMVPVWLTPDEVTGYYEQIANGVLWPLFHYLPEQLPLQITDWSVYEEVNARFAAAVAAVHRPGDQIWVHDYHLMLVPDMLRVRLPDAQIGFFLHIPFPSFEVFRTLPSRERLLEGMLGADLVGFHTATYGRNFTSSLLRLLGLAARVDRVQVGDREVRIGVFPMGIDAREWASLGEDPEVRSEARSLVGDGDGTLIVGIDRLDYTKGIPRRLLAFQSLLEKHPELHERVRLVQVAVPSRSGVAAYRDFRSQIESLVGHVNGRFGTPHWAPVHYIHRNLNPREVAALYRAADVMLVTPVRDGMNLVAKEFVAARSDEGGVLVLSEFAGAASELAEALRVNPYDIESTAETVYRAITLPDEERSNRMRALRRRVFSYDVQRWARDFLAALEDAGARSRQASVAVSSPTTIGDELAKLRSAPALVLLLDYDGTLVPIADVPNLATPDAELLDLLLRLATRPATTVHVISGRTRETLERWLGGLPVWLHGEHGLWSRRPGGDWELAATLPTAWCERALPILEDFGARTPGSLVEEKSAGLAWHYRMADPEFGAHQANELRMHLSDLLSNEPVEIVSGARVIELRPHGLQKSRIVEMAVQAAPPDAMLLAMGDDSADEDLFAALPPRSVTIHVGATPSNAGLRVGQWSKARALLARLFDDDAETGRPA